MATVDQPRATVDDLYGVEGKAELIGGRIVTEMATDFDAHLIGCNIYDSLKVHQKQFRRGVAFSDGLGFVVPELASGRESFTPDAGFYAGPRPATGRRFVSGPPTFAVEVRSEGDYGPAAERKMAAKRADYFEAGTLVVWDVDPDDRVIRSFRPGAAEPITFAPGQVADAEPAVPGWTIAVAEVFATDEGDPA